MEPKFEARVGMEFCFSEKTSPCCICANICRAAESMDDLVAASISELAAQVSAPAVEANARSTNPHRVTMDFNLVFRRI